jgi:hypothetical protein
MLDCCVYYKTGGDKEIVRESERGEKSALRNDAVSHLIMWRRQQMNEGMLELTMTQ